MEMVDKDMGRTIHIRYTRYKRRKDGTASVYDRENWI